MARKTDVNYKKDAARLSDRFPALEKLAKQRKKLTPAQKAQISRANNVARIMRENVADRPEKYQKYRFPAERHPPEKFYKDAARKIAKFTDDPQKYRTWAAKKTKLTGAQKAAIRKKIDIARHTENFYALTPAQAKKLPAHALVQDRDKAGRVSTRLNAIRLRNLSDDGKVLRILKNGTMTVRSGGRKWYYIPCGTEAEILAAEAEDAFAKGAQEVYFWTVHGRVGGGSGDMEEFLIQLSERYMQYLTASEQAKQSTDWLLGIAYYV